VEKMGWKIKRIFAANITDEEVCDNIRELKKGWEPFAIQSYGNGFWIWLRKKN
jgi:hypothetical protein